MTDIAYPKGLMIMFFKYQSNIPWHHLDIKSIVLIHISDARVIIQSIKSKLTAHYANYDIRFAQNIQQP